MIIEQLYSLIIYLVSGIVIGILFDIFRVLRKTFKTSDIITYLEDIIFWIITGFLLIFIIFKFSNGQIRIYNVFGLFIGLLLYMLIFSKFFIKLNVKIVLLIKNIFYKIFKILIFPIKILLKILKRIFKPFTFFVINIKNITNKTLKK